MKLDKLSKKVLKVFIKFDKPLAPSSVIENLKEKYWDYDKIDKCFSILSECNYIRPINNQTLDNKSYSYELTNNGRHYFDVKFSYIFKTYIYPVITALISLLLSLLLR